MLFRLVLTAFLLVPVGSVAQPQANDQELAAMAKLPPLVGTWEGEGWIRMGPGDPERFVGQERVESRLDGRALLIEGKHWTPDRARLVHNALAMLTFDPANGNYLFRTQVTGRPPGDFRGRVEDGAFIWEMSTPHGKIRYIIRVIEDEWIETGEIDSNGAWQKFFDMKLKRVK